MATRHELLHREREVVDAALNALAETTGITSRVETTEPRTDGRARRADAIVDLTAGGRKHRYLVECKRTVDRAATLALVHAQLAEQAGAGLLVTQHLSPQLAEHSRQLGLQFIDTAGNAYLCADGLYVFVNGRKPSGLQPRTVQRSAGNATALRMTFALLSAPALLQASYRDIAQAAGIALGSVGAVFADLAARGLLIESPKGRRWAAPERVLDEWVASYPTVLRPKLHARRFRARDPAWWEHARLDGLHASWGGEVAAARMTGYLKPATQTLYVEPDAMRDTLRELASTHQLQAQANGPIELLERFWQLPPDTPAESAIAPPILVYADLIASMNPRNLEAASLIRKEDIARAFDPR
ncbi:type IV toxin-antitoxin system AbiEi family antitoxin [Ralstonia sp. UBA689]|uniref:type IV toxin-antitoxin system AbiEi family antitoxin n=1 Tax=Ralstonia sp. UBA689 TaxID=1947373 RepID=UPI0025F31B67|nr:type IV toxin-antitoxin system AbiEi family antitoxin [Ralstonia sp. UBA689]